MKQHLPSFFKIFALLVLVLGIHQQVYSQGAACSGAASITQDGACASGTVTDATLTGFSTPTCGSQSRDGWYSFVATSANVTVTTSSGNRQLLVQIYSGSCASLSLLTCVNSNTTAGAQTETASLTGLTIGTTYFIRLVNENNSNMTINSCCVTTTPPPPANDNCSGAITLTVSSTCSGISGTNASATASTGVSAPSCSTYGSNDVWYKFTAPSDNLEINVASGTMTDAAMSLYSGSCGSFTEVECDNDGGPGTMPYISRCDFVAGTTYYIRVWGDGGVSGTFTICVNNTGGASSASTNNCAGGTTVCNDASFSGNSSGAGTQELSGTNQGCLSTEHQSSWYFFQAQTSGTIQLNITPTNGTDDYDFAVWGPFTSGVTCPPCASPLRCSWAAGGGTTGLSTSASDNSEGSGGNRFVAAINATAGQQFVMVIDNFTSSSSPFTLDWTLTAGASLGCTLLPIQLTNFEGTNEGAHNKLTWTTASETDNDHFTVERSEDGFNYTEMTRVTGSGTTTSAHTYHAFDENPVALTYYRLKQTDFNGHFVYSNVVTVKGPGTENNIPIEIFPIPATEQLNMIFSEGIPDNTVVYLTDLTGRIVLNENLSSESGTRHTVQLAGLKKGIYLLTAESKDLHKRSSIKKIVIE